MERRDVEEVQRNDSFDELGEPDLNIGNEADRVERVLEWLQNAEAYVGNEFWGFWDGIVEEQQYAEGMIVDDVNNYFKKRTTEINRWMGKIKKELNQINDEYEKAGNESPLPEIPEIGEAPQDPPSQCVMGSTRVNPVTCEIEYCTEDGSWLGRGQYSQKCIDDKNKPPDPPDPPIDDPVNQNPCDTTAINDWLNQGRGNLYDILPYMNYGNIPPANPLYATMHISPDIAMNLLGMKREFLVSKLGRFAIDGMDTGGGGSDCGELIPACVSIPYARNTLDKVSIYTEQGENIWRQKYIVDSGWQYHNTYEKPEDYLTKSLPYLPDYGEKLELPDLDLSSLSKYYKGNNNA